MFSDRVGTPRSDLPVEEDLNDEDEASQSNPDDESGLDLVKEEVA